MKTSTFINMLNLITSVLTASICVIPYALLLVHIYVPVIVLFPWAVITVIAWVLTSCATDVDMEQTGGANLG